MEQKILDAYRNTELDKFFGCIALTGLGALVVSAIIDNTPLSIEGASLIGSATVGNMVNYMRAYLEATLDYKANNKFTKLKE